MRTTYGGNAWWLQGRGEGGEFLSAKEAARREVMRQEAEFNRRWKEQATRRCNELRDALYMAYPQDADVERCWEDFWATVPDDADNKSIAQMAYRETRRLRGLPEMELGDEGLPDGGRPTS